MRCSSGGTSVRLKTWKRSTSTLSSRSICSACGVPLVYDEVYTGFRLSERGAIGFYGVQPDVVVGVGRHAAHALLCAPGAPGEGSGAGTRKQPPPLGQLRGRWHRPELGGEPRWATAVYHPAYLLRNPQREPESPKAKMWDDIRMIRAKLDELESARTGGGGAP